MSSQRPPKLELSDRIKFGSIAVAARRERAEAKRELIERKKSIFDLINDARPAIRRMKVMDLLQATPGIGARRAYLIMSKAKISASRRIGGLGKHQIEALKRELILTKMSPTKGQLIVMSGPGGVGKSTISNLLREHPSFWVSVSVTTRAPRENEIEGKDYFYVDEDTFERMISMNHFLEWAEFAGNKYGTPKSEVEKQLNDGKHVILEIEVAGARQVKSVTSDAIFVFIAPPSWEELEARLVSRGTDTPERRAARLALAEAEMAAANEFDQIIVNTDVNQVVQALVSLVSRPKE